MMILRLFLAFAKVGLMGFGGGLAILPLIYQSVNKFYYISQSEFADLFAISQATPGPIAVNAATFVGYKVAGIPGSLAATIGVATPAIILVMIASKLLSKYNDSSVVKGAFQGIRPAAVGMVAAAVIFIGEGSLFNIDVSLAESISEVIAGINPAALIIAIVTFVLASKTKLGSIKLIIIMGISGVVLAALGVV